MRAKLSKVTWDEKGREQVARRKITSDMCWKGEGVQRRGGERKRREKIIERAEKHWQRGDVLGEVECGLMWYDGPVPLFITYTHRARPGAFQCDECDLMRCWYHITPMRRRETDEKPWHVCVSVCTRGRDHNQCELKWWIKAVKWSLYGGWTWMYICICWTRTAADGLESTTCD